jgi:hypothetical protein
VNGGPTNMILLSSPSLLASVSQVPTQGFELPRRPLPPCKGLTPSAEHDRVAQRACVFPTRRSTTWKHYPAQLLQLIMLALRSQNRERRRDKQLKLEQLNVRIISVRVFVGPLLTLAAHFHSRRWYLKHVAYMLTALIHMEQHHMG